MTKISEAKMPQGKQLAVSFLAVLFLVSAPLFADTRGRAAAPVTPNPPPINVKEKCVPAGITAQPISAPVWIPLSSSSTLSVGVTGTGPITVEWYTNDGTLVGSGATLPVSPSLNTSYYALVSNGCKTVKSADVWVMIATPVITEDPTANHLAITVGQTATLQAGGGMGLGPFEFKWYTKDGTYFADGKKCVVRPVVTTTYYYTLANAWESAPSKNITITVLGK